MDIKHRRLDYLQKTMDKKDYDVLSIHNFDSDIEIKNTDIQPYIYSICTIYKIYRLVVIYDNK
jgi:histidinol phosphatase-like PHP family hydrolase